MYFKIEKTVWTMKDTFCKGLPNKEHCYLLVNLTPSDVFRILHIEL